MRKKGRWKVSCWKKIKRKLQKKGEHKRRVRQKNKKEIQRERELPFGGSSKQRRGSEGENFAGKRKKKGGNFGVGVGFELEWG